MSDLPEVHVSDISTFRNCRWRWDWSSNLRQNLERDIPVPHFLLGRAVHYAMAQYYEGYDALEAYERYIEQDLHLSDHLSMLEDLDLKTTIIENVILGRGMVAHYVTWAPRHDTDWEVLSTEKVEVLPVIHTSNGHFDYLFHGRMDGIWRQKSTGGLWLKEFKTARSLKETDFIYRDPQPMLYLKMAEEAIGEELLGMLYTFMWKKVPEMPKRLEKSGEFSKNKKQNTTASLYMQALTNDAANMAADSNGDVDDEAYKRMMTHFMADYADILSHLADQEDRYFMRIPLEKTRYEIEHNLVYLDQTAQEMVDPDVALYPMPSQMKCPRCPFNEPCRIRHMGGSYDHLINEDYRHRSSWETKLLEEK